MSQKKIISLVLSLVLVIAFKSVVGAQTSPIAIENMSKVFGVGVGIYPDYLGSNNYSVGAAPFGFLDVSHGHPGRGASRDEGAMTP